MAFWNKNKPSSAIERLADERIYELVLEEIESGVRRGGLWLQALEKSKGDEKQAKLLYISYRVQAMKDELSVSSVLQESEARRTYDRLNKYDESGLTPLMRAVKELDLNQVSSLLGQGADPNIKDGRFGTTTAMDMAIRALGTAATEHERTRLRHIFDALDIAAQRI